MNKKDFTTQQLRSAHIIFRWCNGHNDQGYHLEEQDYEVHAFSDWDSIQKPIMTVITHTAGYYQSHS